MVDDGHGRDDKGEGWRNEQRDGERDTVAIVHSPLLQPTSRLSSGSAESGIDALSSKLVPVRGLLDNHKVGIYRIPCAP